MSGTRFDIQFTGELISGTDPLVAQQRIQTLFRLSDAAVAQLFSGQRVTIKRDVDTETASRYRERFRDAGALIQVIPVPADEGSAVAALGAPTTPAVPTAPQGDTVEPTPGPNTAHLSLGPPGESLAEYPVVAPPPTDISHLTLVPGSDWSFEDCLPPPVPVRFPDIGHLHLVPRPADPEATQTWPLAPLET